MLTLPFAVAVGEPLGVLVALRLGVGVELLLALGHPVERRLGDVDVARLDQLLHLPEEEGQQQRPDVRAVHVGVGHQDDLVVPRVLQLEILLHAGADGGDHRPDLLVAEDLVDPGPLDVQDLAAERQDGLERAVAALLGAAAGRVALDQVDLASAPDRRASSRPACPGSTAFSRPDFFRTRSRALRAASRARAALTAFSMMFRATGGCSSR